MKFYNLLAAGTLLLLAACTHDNVDQPEAARPPERLARMLQFDTSFTPNRLVAKTEYSWDAQDRLSLAASTLYDAGGAIGSVSYTRYFYNSPSDSLAARTETTDTSMGPAPGISFARRFFSWQNGLQVFDSTYQENSQGISKLVVRRADLGNGRYRLDRHWDFGGQVSDGSGIIHMTAGNNQLQQVDTLHWNDGGYQYDVRSELQITYTTQANPFYWVALPITTFAENNEPLLHNRPARWLTASYFSSFRNLTMPPASLDYNVTYGYHFDDRGRVTRINRFYSSTQNAPGANTIVLVLEYR